MYPTRVVILGGGFAGVYAARRLVKRVKATPGLDLRVYLINRENYLVFQPMLPEVLSGSVGLADTVTPIRRICPEAFLQTRDIDSVDVANQTVTCAPDIKPRPLVLPYDHLIVAMGNVTDFRGMPGLPEHARPFKTLGDALALRNHIIHLLEEAEDESDAKTRRQMLTFIVAGGGFSGVEVIAEIHDFCRRAMRDYSRIRPEEYRFILIHSRDRIMPEVDPALALYAQKLLTKRGIEIILNARLSAATGSEAILADGTRIPTKTLVATVPSSPNPVVEGLIKSFGFTRKEKDGSARPHDRLLVDANLRVIGSANVWAMGDCALIPLPPDPKDPKTPVFAPPTAQHAIREAELAADNIIASLQGKAMKPFVFRGLGVMAALGHRRGIAQIMGIKLSGFLAWWMWRTVYLMKLPGLDRKVRVGAAWAIDLIFPPDLVQLRVGKSTGVAQEHFEPGECVFEQGDVGDRFYIVIKGKAQVVRRDTPDGPDIVLAELGKGQYFGEMSLIQRCERNATVRCVESLDVLALNKSEFNAMFSYMADMRKEIERAAAERGGVAAKAEPEAEKTL
jgi:NADH dehydrogenase